MKIHALIKKAYSVLDGAELSKPDALALAENIGGSDLPDLLSLANKVREKFAPGMCCCSILNAKSGLCPQNCKFCAQSARHNANIEAYPQLDTEEVLKAARQAYDSGVRSFGYVTSGYGYPEPNDEFNRILEALDALRVRFPDMQLCVSIGILSRETARLLAEHHTGRYNMNLQTSPKRYGELIADSHTIEEKIQTIKYLQEFGVKICCGGIIGLGENFEDRIDMALAIRELNIEGIPLNVLLPIPGTPLENAPAVAAADVAKTFALFRLINPSRQIKFAAGRETIMKDFQALLMLSGANSLMTGGYLTTRGRSIDEDKKFIAELNKFSSTV
jgi:biotin synthase